MKEKLYKCLATDCDRKLEKKYLYCGIECAAYAGYFSVRSLKPWPKFCLKVKQFFYYRWHMFLRLFI